VDLDGDGDGDGGWMSMSMALLTARQRVGNIEITFRPSTLQMQQF